MDQDGLYEIVHLNQRCPRCEGEVSDVEKDTSSGRDLRYYMCSSCSWDGWVDVGIATWKAFWEANKVNLYNLAYVQRHCPECSGAVSEVDTHSGGDIRFFKCSACSWSASIDVALGRAHSQSDEERS